MPKGPIYQTAIAFLTLAALAGAVFLLASPGEPPGVQITVAPPPPEAAHLSSSGPQAVGPDGRVNINIASAADLATALPLIGPVRAESIVSYREANGPFLATYQLMEVPGIGEGIYERVRDLVTVGD